MLIVVLDLNFYTINIPRARHAGLQLENNGRIPGLQVLGIRENNGDSRITASSTHIISDRKFTRGSLIDNGSWSRRPHATPRAQDRPSGENRDGIRGAEKVDIRPIFIIVIDRCNKLVQDRTGLHR